MTSASRKWSVTDKPTLEDSHTSSHARLSHLNYRSCFSHRRADGHATPRSRASQSPSADKVRTRLRDDLTTASGAKMNLNPNTHRWCLEGVVGRGVGKGQEGV